MIFVNLDKIQYSQIKSPDTFSVNLDQKDGKLSLGR